MPSDYDEIDAMLGRPRPGPDLGVVALEHQRNGLSAEQILATDKRFARMDLLTLTRLLRELTDTRPRAKAALAGAALDMAHSVIESNDPKVHLAALKGLRVIDETEGSGLTIIVGAGGAVQVNIGAKDQS